MMKTMKAGIQFTLVLMTFKYTALVLMALVEEMAKGCRCGQMMCLSLLSASMIAIYTLLSACHSLGKNHANLAFVRDTGVEFYKRK